MTFSSKKKIHPTLRKNHFPVIKPQAKGMHDYHLVWFDEFDDTKLDTTKWAYLENSKHWSTQKPENVFIAEGKLHLILKKEEACGMQYTGGGVISRQTFKYGYYEARFKIPPGGGWHTSFWMMRLTISGGLAAQELDVCENNSVSPSHYEVTVHKWNPPPHTAMEVGIIKTPNLSKDFHTFGCEFTKQTAKYFFDGRLMKTYDITALEHNDHNIILSSIASFLGGTKAVDETKLPAEAVYEYVRFFKKTGN